jgi:pimeloyl-ACP methyl ester carboxylesterase
MRASLITLTALTTVVVSLSNSGISAERRSAAPAVPPAAAAAPCTTATAECTSWVTLNGGPARSMVYTTYGLDTPNTAITRALIMVHGTNRNADHYFDTAKAAAFLAGAINDTVVISPRIASADGSCKDTLAANEVSYSCGGDSWKSGGNAASNKDISSYDFVDESLRKLANRKTFPNLTAIVVAGHSAGGQFANRYSMTNKVHGTLGVNITYVVANPSSYAWPDATRPMPQDDALAANAVAAWASEAVHTQFTFGTALTRQPGRAGRPEQNCDQTYNRWPTGLENRQAVNGYTAAMSDDQLKKQLAERSVTYLLGQVDTLPLGGFDSSCAAMAQGATRRARGEAFAKFVNDKLGAKHAIQIVPECAHNDRCMYTTDSVFPVIFPKPSK